MKGKRVIMLQRTSIYNFTSAILTIFFVSTSNAMAYEEPKYKLIKTTDVYEIREYEERLAVKTTQSKSQNGAFRRLFNDIKHSARLFEALRKDNVLTTGDRMMATNNNPKAKTVCE